MASRAQAAQADDNQFDDLFDYDIDTEIPDLDVSLDVPGQKNTSTRKVDLGVDEEVKITKVKRPTVKLDAERYGGPQSITLIFCEYFLTLTDSCPHKASPSSAELPPNNWARNLREKVTNTKMLPEYWLSINFGPMIYIEKQPSGTQYQSLRSLVIQREFKLLGISI